MIKAVLFDYGGVLTEGGGKDSISNIITDLFGEEIVPVKIDDLHSRLRRGLITTKEFFDELGRRHGSQRIVTEAEWQKASQAAFERSPKVYRLAADLRARGLRTGILSNIYKMTANIIRQIGNYDGFDPLILSCEVHLEKPDPAIYQLAIERLGCEPQEIIFVDDQTKCIPAAQSLGLHTVLAVSPQQIVDEVERIITEQAGN